MASSKFKIYPNAYYNYLKDRKSKYGKLKTSVQQKIVELYHREVGVPGYQMMCDYLKKCNIFYSCTAIYKYMLELGLGSIVRKKKPHMDFTYLPQKNGAVRYNRTIIDLFDRFAVATLNGNHITAELAIDTLRLALERHNPDKGLMLHSDQGGQFTSKDFSSYCEKNHVQQNMSHAGCPYDNAPMKRFYNTR